MSLADEYCRDVELSTGEVVGLSFTAQAGFVSAIAVVALLGVIVFKYQNRAREPSVSWKLVRTNIDGLMLNLLIADLIMSLGAILDIKWAHKAKVSCGGHCNAQGAIQLVGETAVALFTLAITALTFVTVVKGRAARCSVFVWGGISLAVWVFVVLWAVVGVSVNDEFYAPTPYWCWISPKYKVQRLLGEYIWLWLAGFGSVLLYTPLFFMLRGNIVWDEEAGWRSVMWRWKRSAMSIVSAQGGLSPYKLLWYPLAYTIVVLPVSIVRWMSRERIPSDEMATATFVTVSIFNLSGVINVVLILLTRTNVLGLGSTRPQSDTLESTKPEHPHLDDPGTEPEPEQDEQWETGFGGPRVILRDDDSEFDSGRINRDRSRSPCERSALGLTGMETRSPGREYLESLGVARTV